MINKFTITSPQPGEWTVGICVSGLEITLPVESMAAADRLLLCLRECVRLRESER